jgi:tetrahydromethanopterin S-methyltransferase subunit G
MDDETELNELKERVAKLEKRVDDLRDEVRTLYTQMERDSGGMQF